MKKFITLIIMMAFSMTLSFAQRGPGRPDPAPRMQHAAPGPRHGTMGPSPIGPRPNRMERIPDGHAPVQMPDYIHMRPAPAPRVYRPVPYGHVYCPHCDRTFWHYHRHFVDGVYIEFHI